MLPRFTNYCWNRLLVVSAEDCADLVTQEVVALWQASRKLSNDTKKGRAAERGHAVFLLKAIVLLAKSRHSFDTNVLAHLVSDRIPDSEFDAAIARCEAVAVDDDDWDVPEWVPTSTRGKAGSVARPGSSSSVTSMTLADATSIFANFDEMVATDNYVQPELDLGP